MRTRRPAVVLVLAGALSLSACGLGNSDASAEVDRTAADAAAAMTSSTYDIPSNDAAWPVVDPSPDHRVEAMAVTGSLWNGSVTLRISVQLHASGWGHDESATRCYRYTFQHVTTDREYHVIDCPSGPPVVLHEPPHPELSSTGAARLSAALTALPPAGRTRTGIQQVVTSLYPPPVASVVTPAATGGGFEIGVGYTGSCMTGVVPASGPAVITSKPRLTCQGG